ncbi:MAG: hypothetical protein M1829_005538 [Trizodia sp. TS-e1964]|nr:MAG: hypothetical protein M1829_005538 [Trizodia sp. TS-e1964]
MTTQQEAVLSSLGVEPAQNRLVSEEKSITMQPFLGELFGVESLLREELDALIPTGPRSTVNWGPKRFTNMQNLQSLANFPNPLQEAAKTRLAEFAIVRARGSIGGSSSSYSLTSQLSQQSAVPQLMMQSHSNSIKVGQVGSDMGYPSFDGYSAYGGHLHFPFMHNTYQTSQESQGFPVFEEFPKFQEPDNQASTAPPAEPKKFVPRYPVPDFTPSVPLAISGQTIRQFQYPASQGLPPTGTSHQNLHQPQQLSYPDQALTAQSNITQQLQQDPVSTKDPELVKVSDIEGSARKQTSSKSYTKVEKWEDSKLARELGPTESLPWKERAAPVHLKPFNQTARSFAMAPGAEVHSYREIHMNSDLSDSKLMVQNPIPKTTKQKLEDAEKWWNFTNPGIEVMRKHVAKYAELDHNLRVDGKASGVFSLEGKVKLPWAHKKCPPECYEKGCDKDDKANLLWIPLLSTFQEYVDRAALGLAPWGAPPEWCIDLNSDGNNTFFGENWSAAPQRMARDPRYRPLPDEYFSQLAQWPGTSPLAPSRPQSVFPTYSRSYDLDPMRR